MTSNTKTEIKALILFAGTGSIERGLDALNRNDESINIEYRGLDLDKKWGHHYTTNILTWDYKEELKNWTPDYLHSSFVCAEFSQLKNTSNHTRNLELGFSLINKTVEIYEYIKTLNPNVIITCENPRNKFARNHEYLLTLNRETCCYCHYGFPYMKPTDFWSNITLKLKMCSKKNPCSFRKKHNYHKVCLGYSGKKPLQISDSKYFSSLRKAGLIVRGFNNTYMRYRIPVPLVYSILEQVTEHIKDMKLNNLMNDLVI